MVDWLDEKKIKKMSPSKTKNEKKFLKVCEQKEKREREIFVLFEKKVVWQIGKESRVLKKVWQKKSKSDQTKNQLLPKNQ